MARDLAHELACNSDPAGPEQAGDYEQLNDRESLLNRRSYLKLGAMAAGAVATGAATGGASASVTADGMSFDRVVDAVTDLGWDPTGNTPIDDALAANIRDGTLIEVPPGTYLVEETHTARDLSNWGIRGTGADKSDVRFVVPQGRAHRIFAIRDMSRNILLENFTFDQYDTWETSIGNVLQVADGLLVRDVEYAGRNPSEHTGATSMLNVYVFEPDGVAVLDGLVRKGPTELVDYPDNPLAVFCGAESVGTLYIRNCHFENCGEHAIYASRCAGNVRIENSYFKNNQNTQARISGEGSWAKDSTFVWDVADHPNKGKFQATTGLTFESGFRGYTGGLVEGCDFICTSSAPNSGCLKVDGSHGAVTVRDSRFKVDADGAEPIWADAPGDSHMIDGEPAKPWDVTLKNVSVTGSAVSERGNTGAIELRGRSGSLMQYNCIEMTGDRDGIVLRNCRNCSIEDTNISVPGDATVFDDAHAHTSNLTYGGSCPLPGEESTSTTPNLPNTLSVRAPDGADAFTYAFSVTGDATLVTSGEYSATPENDDGVGEAVTQNPDGTVTVTGIVADGGGDTFNYSGEVAAFAAEGDPTVYRNGTQVAPSELGLPNWLVVTAPEGADAFDYEFTVSGDAELVTTGEYSATPENDDGVGEAVVSNRDGTTTVTGIVADGGGDTFSYDGAVTDFRAGGEPTAYRNGAAFDLSQFSLPNTLTLIADDGADAFDYSVTVSGDAELVTEGEYAAKPANPGGVGETVTQNPDGTTTVDGVVANGGGDTFDYGGEVVGFSAEGPVTVVRNGTEISPAVLGLTEELTITGTDVSTVANYDLTVTGDLAPNPDEGSFQSDDSISGGSAEGVVTDGTDSYLFSGNLAAFTLDGPAEVYLNDQLVDPAELGLDHELRIHGWGAESASYSLSVDGDLVFNPDRDPESDDAIEGGTVTGTVTDGVDSYLFSGSVTGFSLSGDAAVYLDGEQVDPDDLGGSNAILPNHFVVDGSNGHASEYAIVVDGEVEKSPDLGSVESTDVIDNGAVKGSVDGDVDGYRFSGDLTRLSVDGTARVTFEDVDG